MLGKLFGRKSANTSVAGSGRSDAITALQELDIAIESIHPERYGDEHEAAGELQSYLVNINTMLGRPETERFYPVAYDALLARAIFFSERGLLLPLLEASKPLPVIHALMQGVLHELRIRHNKHEHNEINFGREVQSSTQTLIGYLNRASSSRPEPMPRRG